MLATNANGLALEVGHLSPTMCSDPLLDTGEIGYIITNLKTTREARVGDTVTLRKYFVQLGASAGWIRVLRRLFVFGGQIIASAHI